jgi:hypothetical protein
VDEIGLTLAELIKEKHELAKDVNTPPALRASIYKELINMIIEASESEREVLKFTVGNKMLKPSKEIHEVEKEKKNEDM